MTPQEVILHIAKVAHAIGWQAGVGGCETAGMIVSCLAARPELIDRFMTEGGGLLIDEGLSWENGCLTFHRSMDGAVTTPQELRIAKSVKAMEREALSPKGGPGK